MQAGPGAADRRRVTLAGGAVLLGAADTYVMVLVLPDVMAGVGLGLDQLQRGAPLVTAFLLGYVLVLPLAGRVCDALGRRPVLVACLLCFAAGSLLTAAAQGLEVAVLGRGLQGLGAGGLVPPTLALVADLWPPSRRGVPLGAVGAAQELGAVLGPLLGAAVLAAAGWRAIFWGNAVLGVLLAALLAPRLRSVRTAAALGLAALGTAATVLALAAPSWLADDLTWGAVLVPVAAAVPFSSPLLLAGVVLVAAAAATALLPRRPAGPDVDRLDVDLLGAALLVPALGGVVLTFAGADTSRAVVDDRWPLYASVSVAGAVGFAVRQRTAARPLVTRGTLAARGARGAVAVNALVGVALVVALVDVPVFARSTTYPDSQLGAALVLVQFLAALPVGALAGGWLSARTPPVRVAVAGMLAAAAGLAAMATWPADALPGAAATAALVTAGFGFGLAIAPVNVVLLASTPPPEHGLASALAVLARTVGMLVGLSVLTAVGLRVFAARQAEVGSPFTLCPATPADCPAFVEATRASVLVELHVIFAAAAAVAVLAAVVAAVLLRAPAAGGRAQEAV